MNGEVLNSWKEIAAYLGRGVRTVQRWEHDLALPVRRPRGRERSAVIALKADLDRWLHNVPQSSFKDGAPENRSQRKKELHLSTTELLERTHLLIERSSRIQKLVQQTLAITIQLKNLREQGIRERADQVIARQKLRKEAERLGLRIRSHAFIVPANGSGVQPEAAMAAYQPEREEIPSRKLAASR